MLKTEFLDLRSVFWMNLTFALSDQKIILFTAVLIALMFVSVIQNCSVSGIISLDSV
jgi:hypothetical protein